MVGTADLAILTFSDSSEFAEPHPINALGECDLGMFTVADITAEGAVTPVPAHRITGFPNRRNPRWALTGAARIPLACFTRLAAWQSRSSRQLFCSRGPHLCEATDMPKLLDG